MTNFKINFHMFQKKHLPVVGVLFLLLLAVFLLWFNNSTSLQAEGVIAAQVYFDGEYRIADGEWQPIEAGNHIPATKGDVTLRINFHLMDPDGNPMNDMERTVPIALYTDHIGLTFYSGGKQIRVIDNENPLSEN